MLETDIPAVSDIPFETSLKLKKLLALIAQSAPFTPNLSQLGQTLYISDQRTLLKYINYLHKAELINVLGIESKGNQLLRKPDKLYLNNTNLMYCFSSQVNVGTQIESFFLNQLQNLHVVTNPSRGDFVAGNVVFEVGGKNTKTNSVPLNIRNMGIQSMCLEKYLCKSIRLCGDLHFLGTDNTQVY